MLINLSCVDGPLITELRDPVFWNNNCKFHSFPWHECRSSENGPRIHIIITAFLQEALSWAICLTAFWVTVICSQETEPLEKRSEDIKLHYVTDMRYVANRWQMLGLLIVTCLMDRAPSSSDLLLKWNIVHFFYMLPQRLFEAWSQTSVMSVRLSTRNITAPTWQVYVKFYNGSL
jgi:hypothetical protein